MLSNLVILGLATATISVTVASSRLFKPIREWVCSKSEWLGDLIGCPYCLGHWVAAVLAFLNWHSWEGWLVLITTLLAVTAISAVVTGLIGRLHARSTTE